VLEQRLAEALGDAAMDLRSTIGVVEHGAAVVDRGIALTATRRSGSTSTSTCDSRSGRSAASRSRGLVSSGSPVARARSATSNSDTRLSVPATSKRRRDTHVGLGRFEQRGRMLAAFLDHASMVRTIAVPTVMVERDATEEKLWTPKSLSPGMLIWVWSSRAGAPRACRTGCDAPARCNARQVTRTPFPGESAPRRPRAASPACLEEARDAETAALAELFASARRAPKR